MSIIYGKVAYPGHTSSREVSDGKGITVPGRAVDIKKQIKAIRSGSITEKIGFYYDDAYHFPGEEPIDVSKMSYIDRLQLLYSKRTEVEQLKGQLAKDANARPEVKIDKDKDGKDDRTGQPISDS